MNEHELSNLLKTPSGESAPGWRCPSTDKVVEYFRAGADLRQKQKFEAHAAKCSACRELLAFLITSEEWPEAAAVPANLLVRARALKTEKSFAIGRWLWPVATAAAVLMLVMVAVVAMRSRNQERTPDDRNLVAEQQTPVAAPPIRPPASLPAVVHTPAPKQTPKINSSPQVRGTTNALKPAITFPHEGALIARNQLSFRWNPAVDAVSYQIKLVDEDGGIVFQDANLTDIQLHIPATVTLVAGKKYFVSVTAYMSNGRSERSELISFRVSK